MSQQINTIALRKAAYQLSELITDGPRLRPIVDEILRNPQTACQQGVICQVTSCLLPHIFADMKDFLKIVRVFFRAVQAFAGEEALGLHRKISIGSNIWVSELLFRLQCPISIPITQNIISAAALHEVVEYFETGEKVFSPETIMEVRELARMWNSEALLQETEVQIGALLGKPGSKDDVKELAEVWADTIQRDDRRLQGFLLTNHPPLRVPQDASLSKKRKNATLQELQAGEFLRLSREWQVAKKRHKITEDAFSYFNGVVDMKCSHETLYMLEKLLRYCYVKELDCRCNDPALAFELALILRQLGTSSLLTKFTLETTDDRVVSIVIPDIVRSTCVTTLYITMKNEMDASLFSIAQPLANCKYLQFLSMRVGYVTSQGLQAVAESLCTNTSLREVYVDQYNLNISFQPLLDTTKILGEVIRRNTHLSHFHSDFIELVLDGNGLAEAVAQNRHLKTLTLPLHDSRNLSTLGGALAVNTTLQNLTIKMAALTDESAPLFEGLSRNKTVSNLTLITKMDSTSVLPLAEMIRLNQSLRKLDINEVFFIDDGQGEILIRSLEKNRNLRNLHLTRPPFSTRTVQAIADLLKQKHPFETLCLNGSLDNMHLQLLADPLADHPTIVDLALDLRGCTLEGFAYLATKLKENQTLMSLTLTPLGHYEDPQVKQLFSEISVIFSSAGFPRNGLSWEFKRG